jgi:PiT family inorganic phosphate transporter
VVELAVALAVAFALTNGFLNSANATATLIATGGAPPGPAVVLGSLMTFVGAVLGGTAVASTIGSLVDVEGRQAVAVFGAGLSGAVVWNVATWVRGLPASAGHSLVGGLTGAALADSGPSAVYWGGLDGWKPVGVLGTFLALAVAPFLGAGASFVLVRAGRRLLRRATRAFDRPIRGGQWCAAGALAFGQGSNDAQKATGAAAAVLLAGGAIDSLAAPTWLTIVAGAALAIGTFAGGSSVIRTVGRRIVRLRPLDALGGGIGSAGIVLASTAVGAPISVTQVTTSSVVGAGTGRRRRRSIRWAIVRNIALAWLITIPASAALGAVLLPLWRWLA